MPKRVQISAGSGVAVEGTEERELQPLDDDDAQEKQSEASQLSQEARIKRAPVIGPSNANAPISFSLSGAAPPLAEDVAPSSAKTLAAPLAVSSSTKSLASAPPLSSDLPSPPPLHKPAATMTPPLINVIPPPSGHPAPPPPAHTADPPPLHAASRLPSLTTLGVLAQNALFSLYRVDAPGALYEKTVRQLLAFRDKNEGAWAQMVGWYFQDSGRSPSQVIGGPTAMWAPAPCGWERDLRKLDVLEKNTTAVDIWRAPAQGTVEAGILTEVGKHGHKQQVFEAAIWQWANSQANTEEVSQVLQKACWTKELWTNAWGVMRNLKRMDEGPLKESMLARAKAESPRYYQRCMDDESCGRKVVLKRKNGEDIHVQIVYGKDGRREKVLTPKRPKTMNDPANGRPTQFHAVPLEERAVDSQGRTLPWALEWHEDHPNARHQKRQPEEKGPFGKSNRRRGSSRMRTTTPAKKENPTVDGFERAMKHDLHKAAEEARLQSIASSRSQNDGSTTAHHPLPSTIKEPTEVMLSGYSPSTQWAAISFYENVSCGMICEDYEREPPSEQRKFPNRFNSASNIRPRSLTKAESALARKYRGGNCWIKVTFDSAEAAERAIYNSPHLLQGYWVYAQLFHGVGPEADKPHPLQEEDRRDGVLAPKPAYRPSLTLGSSIAQNNNGYSRGGASTFPRSFAGNTSTETEAQPEAGPSSLSSSATASSATATAPTVEYPNLRNRHSNKPPATNNNNRNESSNDGQAATLEPSPPVRNPHFFTHFPNVPRTVLRPAHEAFLPHPTWFEATMARLSAAGWLPGDMIGDGVPRLENGGFDWAKASLYWKFFYWIDSRFGTDICGMKDDD